MQILPLSETGNYDDSFLLPSSDYIHTDGFVNELYATTVAVHTLLVQYCSETVALLRSELIYYESA